MLLGVAAAFSFVLGAQAALGDRRLLAPDRRRPGALLFGPLAMVPSAWSCCFSRRCCWPTAG